MPVTLNTSLQSRNGVTINVVESCWVHLIVTTFGPTTQYYMHTWLWLQVSCLMQTECSGKKCHTITYHSTKKARSDIADDVHLCEI